MQLFHSRVKTADMAAEGKHVACSIPRSLLLTEGGYSTDAQARHCVVDSPSILDTVVVSVPRTATSLTDGLLRLVN